MYNDRNWTDQAISLADRVELKSTNIEMMCIVLSDQENECR